MSATIGAHACDPCLRRGWLLRRLTGHLDCERARIGELLVLDDEELLTAVAGAERDAVRAELEALEPDVLRADAVRAGLEVCCRCCQSWPAALRGFDGAPAALYVAGSPERLAALASGGDRSGVPVRGERRVALAGGDHSHVAMAGEGPDAGVHAEAVAIVGTRHASPHGLELARALGRDLSVAGLTVVSGMALGIDAAALTGALEGGGCPIAVLPAGAERAYPAAHRALYRRILASGGAAVSELPPGSAVRSWTFLARNRVIASLAAMTVVVEASADSGALLTASWTLRLQRLLGAVPGRVGARQAEGPNELLARGALVVRDARDVLERLLGPGAHALGCSPRRPLDPGQERVLAMIEEGLDTTAALVAAGVAPERALPLLAELELGGFVRRGAGGRFVTVRRSR